MVCRVKWGDKFSDSFNVPLGTKQGGISSPKFFALYVDDLVKRLRNSGVGCHMINLFVGCILFADDLALLAPSRAALQKMINICYVYMSENCLEFNTKKSKVLVFGKSYNFPNLAPLLINDLPIEYVQEWKYLGVTLTNGTTLGFSARPDLMSFFRATNAVLNVLKGAKEHVLLSLLYTNCVPILTYAASVKEYSASEMSDCNVAMNNAFRKIFGFKEWRSIRILREIFNFESIYVLFKTAREKFLASCAFHPNPVIKFIHNLDRD